MGEQEVVRGSLTAGVLFIYVVFPSIIGYVTATRHTFENNRRGYYMLMKPGGSENGGLILSVSGHLVFRLNPRP